MIQFTVITIGPLDAGFTTSFYKMLDIMYKYGTGGTKELAVAMKKQLGISVVEQSTKVNVPVQVPQPQQPDVVSNSSTNGNGAGASECMYVCVHCNT